ncbi:MAG: tRNA-dihydrouridine synthase [Candidatus Dojkabacteria bacterium]|nr:MAG: tRNA-dihydrouridine synthase [Candidatus Dojkabacteria bacterium]
MMDSPLWTSLKQQSQATNRAFTILAPMEDVTDTVFRQIVCEYGRPDLFMTEFTNCEGLLSDKGREHVAHRLQFTHQELPLVAQIWATQVESYVAIIPELIERGFSGVDINMGCPVVNVVKNGAGSGLIRDFEKTKEIIHRVREKIEEIDPHFGFSVKTRIGFTLIQPEWVTFLMQQPIDALTLHLRTRKEMTRVPAHWELAKEYSQMREALNPDLVLIANGDITSRQHIHDTKVTYGFDGAMVGRGIFEDISIFSESPTHLSRGQRLQALRKHILLFQETWGNSKNFELLKKYFKIYLRDFPGSAQLRNELIIMKDAEEMLQRIDSELSHV